MRAGIGRSVALLIAVGAFSVSVVGAADIAFADSVTATIPVGQTPTGVAIAGGGPSAYVADSAMSKMQQQQKALIAFNGYYSLSNSPDAWFYVDTNMYVSPGSSKPKYVVSLRVSLDGKTSQSVDFKGRFDGKRLTQRTVDGPSFDLTFKRKADRLGPTATVSGTITLPGQAPTASSGVTYSNPIPQSFWGGQTYFAPASKPGGKPIAAVKMGKTGELFYDNGSNGKPLVRVKSYRYNLDMYYFRFTGTDLIMGTAGQSGFAMNNLVTKDDGVITRSLVTQPRASEPGTGNWYPQFHLNQGPTGLKLREGATLSDFSGYYPIPTKKHPKAFISIQGVGLTLIPGIEATVPGASPGSLYRVLISVSADGKTVKSWYYDTGRQMTFDGRVLRMPKQGITLNIKRRYSPPAGTLFTMTGKIQQRDVQGSSVLNTIPLSIFAGTMKDKSGQHELVISPTGDVTFDGQVISNYEYVPTMFILVGPLPGTTIDNKPPIMLSLGYDGAAGKAAIVTMDYGTPQAKVVSVFAIPSES